MYYNLSANQKLTIRPIKIADLDSIVCIEKETYGEFGWSHNTFLNEINNDYSVYYLSELKLSDTFKIVGYIGAWLVGDEAHITTMVVSSKYRRVHIADILLYNLIKSVQSKGIKWLTLEVKSSNNPAINLYNKFKFKQLGIRKKYYQDNNEDALLLWTEDINKPEYIEHINSIFNQLRWEIVGADKYQYSHIPNIV